MKTLVFDVDRFLKIFDITHPDDILEKIYEYPLDLDFSEEDFSGLTEEQKEEKILEAEDLEIEGQVTEYKNNLESSVQQFLTNYPIRGIDSVTFDWNDGKVLVNVEDLDELLTSIRLAIDGYGMFYAPTNESLINVGPYEDIAEACTKLFHNLADIPEIYGTSNIRRIMERRY